MRLNFKLVRTCLWVFALGICFSCVDADYDFKKLDKEITVGGENLKINIGSTKKYLLADLVNEFGGLNGGSDGSYDVSVSTDPINISLEGLKEIKANVAVDHSSSTLSDISVFLDSVKQLDAATLATMPEEIDLSDLVKQSADISSSNHEVNIKFKGLPREIVSLKDVQLSEGAKLRLTISAPDCILTSGSILPELTVNLNNLFEVGNSDGVHFSGDELNPSNGYKVVKDFPLKRLVIGPDSFDATTRSLTLKDNVSCSGSIKLLDPKTTKTRYSQVGKDITLKINVDVIDLKVASITGGFNYNISKLQTTFTIGGMFAGFDYDSAVLDFANPTLDINVYSNLGIPVKADLEFIPVKGDNELDTKVTTTIVIPAAPDPSKPASHVFRFSKTGESEGDIIGVKADLPALLRTIPDVVKINLTAGTDKDSDGMIEIGKSYDMTVNMAVKVPMAFGKGLRIDYRDTIAFNISGMEDLLNSNTLVLGGTLDNSMPLNYRLSVDIVDSEFNPVAETMTQDVKADSQTDLNMELKKIPSAVNPMAAMIMCFNLTSGSDNAVLKADNYIQARDITLGLPGGLTIDLNK